MKKEERIPIYSGKPENFHWAGFGSGSGTNLRECAKVITPSLIFSDRPSAGLFSWEELSWERGVVQEAINGYEACGSWKKAQGNSQLESEYQERSLEFNQAIVDLLHKYEERQQAPFDLIVLGGYMRLIKSPLLEAYKDRMINVHPADLGILVVDSENAEKYIRKYIGDKAVYNALEAGEEVSRSSVIMVDEGEDHGEILTQGPELEVWHEFLEGTDAERQECIEEYADSFQNFQKVRSDWPALTSALEMIAHGRFALGTEMAYYNEWRRVYLDGKMLEDYCGFQVVPGGK